MARSWYVGIIRKTRPTGVRNSLKLRPSALTENATETAPYPPRSLSSIIPQYRHELLRLCRQLSPGSCDRLVRLETGFSPPIRLPASNLLPQLVSSGVVPLSFAAHREIRDVEQVHAKVKKSVSLPRAPLYARSCIHVYRKDANKRPSSMSRGALYLLLYTVQSCPPVGHS